MEVHFTPETAKKLNDLAASSGRASNEIVEDALAGYLEEVAAVRKTLDSRVRRPQERSRQTDRRRGGLQATA